MWQDLIENLVTSGMGVQRIALRLNISKEGVRKLRVGITKEPRFTVGRKLYLLHETICQKDNLLDSGQVDEDFHSALKKIDRKERLLAEMLAHAPSDD